MHESSSNSFFYRRVSWPRTLWKNVVVLRIVPAGMHLRPALRSRVYSYAIFLRASILRDTQLCVLFDSFFSDLQTMNPVKISLSCVNGALSIAYYSEVYAGL